MRGSAGKARGVGAGGPGGEAGPRGTTDDEGVFMKRSWTALAVALPAIFAAMGCNDYGNTFQVPTGGTITSLSPANVTAGSPPLTFTGGGRRPFANTLVQLDGQNPTPTLLS